MLCRISDVTSGSISIGGENIKNVNLYDLRSAIGYVPQESFLFSDSIYNNIAFGKQECTEDEVIHAAQKAGIYNNIKQFKNQFKTIIGERGVTLSGGQKQRLSIARALIRKPKFMLLDDCLSAVDTKTEEHILNNIKKQSQNNTCIIISHRISSIKHADQIILLKQGEILEQGDHNTLVNNNGEYNRIFKKQLAESK